MTDRPSPKAGEVPLIWAHNIRAGKEIVPSVRKARPLISNDLISCVHIGSSSTALRRSPSIVLQRTSNRKQARRLTAGFVSEEFIARFGGFVTENHTILIIPDNPRVPLQTMLSIINTQAVDDTYRQMCGTVSVSTRLLRMLPLPNYDDLLAMLDNGYDMENACAEIYSLSC